MTSGVESARTGAEEIARVLRLQGIDFVFALCGDHINNLFLALDEVGIDIIDFRHESAGVQMADGYARATGRPAVCIVTGGPGHSNALTGLAVAHSAGTPVILISGETPTNQWEHGGQQIMRQAEMAAPVTKWAVDVASSEKVGEIVARAFAIAEAPRPGPVSISASPTVLSGPVETPNAVAPRHRLEARRPTSVGQIPDLSDAAAMLAKAERPVVIAGSGVADDGETAASALTRLGAPVFTIDQARGMLADGASPCFGYADPLFNRAFRRGAGADLVLLAGAAFDFHTCFARTHLVPAAASVIQITNDPHHQGMNRGPDLLFAGPEGAVLTELVNLATTPESPSYAAWINDIARTYRDQRAWFDSADARGDAHDTAIHPIDLMHALAPHRTEDHAIVVDVGDFIHWPRLFFEARRPRRFHDGVLSGNLGSAIPLAIGVQMADRRKPVWAFCGDGGFQFHTWELATAAKFDLPIKVIVGNDRAWGVELRLQRNEFGRDIGCQLPNVRYHEISRILGVGGYCAMTRDALPDAVSAFLAHDGPAVLNVEIPQMAGRPFADFPR